MSAPGLLILCILGMAFFYSSVGHGGASGYLAAMALFSVPQSEMGASALLLNLLVAGAAFWIFFRHSFFSWRLTWPFVVTSIPAAFAGGMIRIPAPAYELLLVAVLLFAAARLFFERPPSGSSEATHNPHSVSAFILGSALGLVSGIVGVGGGIFLSPFLIFCGWAGPKRAAATSAFFIWVNSLAGLLGRLAASQLDLSPWLLAPAVFAFAGGLLGSRLGAAYFSSLALRRILGLVLVAATFKMIFA